MEGKKRISGLKLALKTSVVSGMTLLSRILGLVRDVVFARFFGAGLLMDAFLVAQRIPNMMRRFFAEGAFSAGFVPVMARYKEQHDHDEAREYLGAMAGTFGIVLFIVTLLGVIGAPLLVLIVAPGFVSDGGDFDLAALMLRFTFPYLFFVSLTAFAGGILNTYGRFGVPAFTPVILNVVLIIAAVWAAPLLEQPIMALAYAVLIAGLLQLIFQLPFLARIHALPRPKWRPNHNGVRRAFKLMVPAIFGSSVAQINVLLSGIIASLLPVGSISYLYYSDRLMEFPLGLFGIALATVTLPYLSRLWANGDSREFAETLEWSMRIALIIAVPAAAGLIILAAPLIITLFHGGECHDCACAASLCCWSGRILVRQSSGAGIFRSRGYAHAGPHRNSGFAGQSRAWCIICLVPEQERVQWASRSPCGRNVYCGYPECLVALRGASQGKRDQAWTRLGNVAAPRRYCQRRDDCNTYAVAKSCGMVACSRPVAACHMVGAVCYCGSRGLFCRTPGAWTQNFAATHEARLTCGL
jgi:O-antigen/teichoic acid export membrane protein